jgi:hypothetical protein
MKRLLLTFFLLSLLPFSALAQDASEEPITCDEGEPVCHCLPDDPYPSEYSAILTEATCDEYCGDLDYLFGSDYDLTEASLACETVVESDPSDSVITEQEQNYLVPNLSVDIPGLEFSELYSDGEAIISNLLSEYVNALYLLLITVGSFVSVLTFTVAGGMYMLARGDSGRVGQAIALLKRAVTGIILILTAATMAEFVFPGLVSFSAISITTIDAVEYVDESPDFPGAVSLPAVEYNGLADGAINCSPDYSVREIVESAVGDVTYRYGAKGGGPVYEQETKTDPDGVPYSSYCPEGTICLDCSGFADYVRSCAGLASAGESGGTAGIFSEASGAEKVLTRDGTNINGTELIEGDLIGRPSSHVFIYLGDGLIGDSHGSGRDPGNAIGIYEIDFAFDKIYKDKQVYVRRR